jgi:hypothetical protein
MHILLEDLISNQTVWYPLMVDAVDICFQLASQSWKSMIWSYLGASVLTKFPNDFHKLSFILKKERKKKVKSSYIWNLGKTLCCLNQTLYASFLIMV